MRRSTADGLGAAAASEAEEPALFENPTDLLCPITLQLFKDPVINSAGHVYERSALEEHFRRGHTSDPLTNQPLDSGNLIPVYALKSRSFEFRERVAKACVEKACTLRTRAAAARHLRRAAELVAGIPHLRVPGLTDEVLQFLQTHPSNAYDFHALQLFADGLRAGGYVDQATNLYLKLVEFGADRSQQAGALKQCLACFGHEQGFYDRAAVPRLAAFVESQQAFTAGQIVELMQEACVNEQLVLQLCEYLLSKHVGPGPGSGSSSDAGAQGTGAGGADGQQGAGVSNGKFQDLLLAYSRLRFAGLQQQVDTLVEAKQVQQATYASSVPPAQQVQQGAGLGAGQHGGLQGPSSWPGHEVTRGPLGLVRRFVVRRRRALMSCLFAGLSLLDGKHLAVRAAQAGSALLLIHGGRRH